MSVIYKIENLIKTYNTSLGALNALDDVTFEIKRGEVFGIIGLSGAGKSTLIRTLNMIERPTSGRIIFDGENICDMTERQLPKIRQQIGMIFQGFNLLKQRTVLKNVYFPLEIAKNLNPQTKQRAAELCELVGVAEKAKEYPKALSGGQKQRVAIARALVNNPKVLLCDEPTSALDPETTGEILKLLKEINKKLGLTIIIITHEMSVVEQACTSVAVLDEGRLAECGSVKDVFASPKSEMARKLIYPHKDNSLISHEKGEIRIVFNGEETNEPVIANMILTLGIPASILFADTKTIDGRTFGQMIIKLPHEDKNYHMALDFLKNKNMTVEELG